MLIRLMNFFAPGNPVLNNFRRRFAKGSLRKKIAIYVVVFDDYVANLSTLMSAFVLLDILKCSLP
jgi:hypothetical protein